jgi:hypothetical protein
VITDAGRTGSIQSVGGCDIRSRIQEYLSGIPDWTREAGVRPEIQGVFIDLDRNGKARSIERFRELLPDLPLPPPQETPGQGAAGPPPEDPEAPAGEAREAGAPAGEAGGGEVSP